MQIILHISNINVQKTKLRINVIFHPEIHTVKVLMLLFSGMYVYIFFKCNQIVYIPYNINMFLLTTTQIKNIFPRHKIVLMKLF